MICQQANDDRLHDAGRGCRRCCCTAHCCSARAAQAQVLATCCDAARSIVRSPDAPRRSRRDAGRRLPQRRQRPPSLLQAGRTAVAGMPPPHDRLQRARPNFRAFRSSAAAHDAAPRERRAAHHRRHRVVIDRRRRRQLARGDLSEPACRRAQGSAFPATTSPCSTAASTAKRPTDMMARFATDVIAAHPASRALAGRHQFRAARSTRSSRIPCELHEGIDELKAAGADVVLIDPQYCAEGSRQVRDAGHGRADRARRQGRERRSVPPLRGDARLARGRSTCRSTFSYRRTGCT